MIFNLFKKKQTKTDITILYGSNSGSSKYIALEASKMLRKKGVEHDCRNLYNFSIEELSKLKYLFLVVNTMDGEKPLPAARELYEYLHQEKTPSLRQLKYSICALGDSSVDNYYKTGIDIDKRLNDLGGQAIINRVECNEDFTVEATIWIKEIVKYFQNNDTLQNELNIPANSKNKFKARVKTKERINHPISNKEIYHLELSVRDNCFSYLPGDSVSIMPRNPEYLIREILKILIRNNFKHTIRLDQYQHIFDLLLTKYEITSINKETVAQYNDFTKNDNLKSLLQNSPELNKFLKGSNLLTLLSIYPCHAPIENILSILPELKPRLYPIASSNKKHQHELHLTVKTNSYSNHQGLCAHYLNHYLRTNDILDIEIVKNNNFRFEAADPRPIIMIATGSGIAPFRCFIEEMEHVKSSREAWLIFGERNAQFDKIYHNELIKYFRRGTLSKWDTVFIGSGQNRFVQDVIKSSKVELLKWVNKGAQIYICGSSAMGRGVRKVLECLLSREEENLSVLIKNKRYKEYLF